MALGDIVPRKWGGLRRWERDERSFDLFRRDMDALHREMDRVFESMWKEGSSTSLLPEFMSRHELMPQLDVAEDDQRFRVTIELPGMDEKDVNVTLSGQTLTIGGNKKEEKEEKEKDFYRRERAYGSFRRSIEVPADVDAANIKASFRKGVLTIELPKTEEAQEKVKHIAVEAG